MMFWEVWKKKAKLKVAKKLLIRGLSIESVSEDTELTVEEVK